MYFPFKNQTELNFNCNSANKLSFPGVHDTVNLNRCKSEQVQVFADNVINKNIRLLNEKQRQVFDIVHKWSKGYIKILILGYPGL